MTDVRVLVVDDSLTMRALFSGVLERAKGIQVVGMAANADEARELMIKLRPQVITLDIEMPGMSGIDFLKEIMRERPTPVVMLSSLTQKGADISIQAMEIGAIDCFPKPKSATADEFNALAPKLAALVHAAAKVDINRARNIKQAAPVAAANTAFDWNGNIIAMSASTGGVDAMLHMLPGLPKDCPPAIMLLQIDEGIVDSLVWRLKSCCAAEVVIAEDGMALQQGHIYIAADPTKHAVIDRWPNPSLRLLGSDPVAGARPSASLLFATMAKTAGANAVGAILTGMGTDGAAGLKAMRATGARTICQNAATSVVYEAPAAAIAAGAVSIELPLDEIVAAALEGCRRTANAA